MKFTIKGLEHAEFASHETHCFKTSLYVDGKRFCVVTNDGKGGSNEYFPINKMSNQNLFSKLRKINAELGKELIPLYADQADNQTIENDLEIVIGELVNDALLDKRIKKDMARRVMFYVPSANGIWNCKIKPTEKHINAVQNQDWWKAENVMLSGKSLDEVRPYYKQVDGA